MKAFFASMYFLCSFKITLAFTEQTVIPKNSSSDPRNLNYVQNKEFSVNNRPLTLPDFPITGNKPEKNEFHENEVNVSPTKSILESPPEPRSEIFSKIDGDSEKFLTEIGRHFKRKKSCSNMVSSDCFRNDFISFFEINLFEIENLITEKHIYVIPVYSSIPFQKIEVNYKEESKKVTILVPVEKIVEKAIIEYKEIEIDVIDKYGCAKKEKELVPVERKIHVTCVEMVPTEIQSSIKVPEFQENPSSITVQTFTGAIGTSAKKLKTIGIKKQEGSGYFSTPVFKFSE